MGTHPTMVDPNSAPARKSLISKCSKWLQASKASLKASELVLCIFSNIPNKTIVYSVQLGEEFCFDSRMFFSIFYN